MGEWAPGRSAEGGERRVNRRKRALKEIGVGGILRVFLITFHQVYIYAHTRQCMPSRILQAAILDGIKINDC